MASEAVKSVLAEYNARLEIEEELMAAFPPGSRNAPERDSLLLAVGEETGRFLQDLAIGCGSKNILEIGTSYGYSTLFLASAAKATGGRVTTLELSEEKQNYAREMLQKAELDDYVEWLTGDALDLIAGLKGPFDFVLLDIWKELYVPSLELFYPKLSAEGIIVADNILYPEAHRRDAQQYRHAVESKEGLNSVLLPIGSGILVSTRL
ncbi:O-methyltransferase [Emcibacter nanhaiensis]|uniref:Methyltransferase domain-containing protein n=1 Tax=Emcibacter nanhaiensis TaxID=1505037 RepID=A0A501PF52_9PROT|nr:class I SAM-dependent methyltransferase [Emcibacter nanhaiensis]TPD59050.1 methyltransferase domain-containing protein [Emcibacter nanhaiensis]